MTGELRRSWKAAAIDALRVLGLTLDQLRAASPYQQVVLIADAASTIVSPLQRATILTALFGHAVARRGTIIGGERS